MRIDKYLADNSIGTRKEIKGIIKSGRICVNGVTAFDPGMHIVPGKDIITLNTKDSITICSTSLRGRSLQQGRELP